MTDEEHARLQVAVDRLFQRLAATYGRAWTSQWDGVPIADVKAAWSHELAGYTHRLASVAWALENLPERVPNAIEFRNLCRRAPAPPAPQLPEPAADPERVRSELAKLRGVLHKTQQPDRLQWARVLVKQAEAGEQVPPYALARARAALMRPNVAEPFETLLLPKK